MNSQWMILLLLSGCFLLLFVVAELLYTKLHVKAEYTRKMTHAGSGLLTLLFPVVLTAAWQAALLCGAFLLLLVVSRKYNLLKSIHAVDRKTSGSTLFPFAVFITFLFFLNGQKHFTHYNPYYYFYVPVLVLALADPVAALAGKWYQQRNGIISSKTAAGSLAFLAVAFAVTLLLTIILKKHSFIISDVLQPTAVSAVTMFAERRSRNGWDNLWIPVAAILVQLIFISFGS